MAIEIKNHKIGKKIRNRWESLTIRKKLRMFTGAVIFILALAVLIDIWVVQFSLVDFSHILDDNASSGAVMETLEQETYYFERYMRDSQEDNRKLLEVAMENTKQAIEQMPFSYETIGAERYARTSAIKTTYDVYTEKRDEILISGESKQDYVKQLYEVYAIQQYLQNYTRDLMWETMADGNDVYWQKVPMLRWLLVGIVLVGFLLLFIMIELGNLMNHSMITPIMKLVDASRKIAANDFFVDDVTVENKDELGDLVSAFNKMKYATGEYILALEEKRTTLDLLHEEELEKLEIQRRLETTNLELLKNQMNPHFLFNTLNVIAGMANLESAGTTQRMIQALSTFFRYNLKTYEVEVSLTQELHVVQEYLYLQQMRFGDRIHFRIDCQVDADAVIVPTFMLQPLVENAIIHGLSPKEEGGKICIRIWQEKDTLLVSVADTGIGMNEATLENLQKELVLEREGATGIGLGNIYKRIKKMYQGSKVEIFSREGVGTVVKLWIPQI